MELIATVTWSAAVFCALALSAIMWDYAERADDAV
jgi:hypothetical protein